MNKKIAIMMLSVSVLGLSVIKARPSEKPKKFAFNLVQQAEKRFQNKIDILQNTIAEITASIKALQTGIDTGEFLKLSEEDKLKLKFLLHQVIRYK